MGYCDSDKGKVDFWRGLYLHHKRVWCLKPHLLKREMKVSPFTPTFYLGEGKATKEWFVEIWRWKDAAAAAFIQFLKSVDRWAKKPSMRAVTLVRKIIQIYLQTFSLLFFSQFFFFYFLFSNCKLFELEKIKINKKEAYNAFNSLKCNKESFRFWTYEGLFIPFCKMKLGVYWFYCYLNLLAI